MEKKNETIAFRCGEKLKGKVKEEAILEERTMSTQILSILKSHYLQKGRSQGFPHNTSQDQSSPSRGVAL